MAATQEDREQELARRQSETEQADVYEQARAKQRAVDAETRAYESDDDAGVDAGIDQAEAYANDPSNASRPSGSGRGDNSKSTGSRTGDTDSGANFLQRSGERLKLAGAFVGRNKKKFIAGGGIGGAVIGLATLAFLGLLPLKLVHIREVLDEYFGKRGNHMVERRVGKIWAQVADKDGNRTYEKNSGHPLRDHIYNVNSRKVVADLKAKGLNVNLDADGRIMLDGERMSGKLADRRSEIRQKLTEAYPEDGYFRRSVRAARVFRIYGIKRTFFENSKEKGREARNKLVKNVRERLFGDNASDPNIRRTVNGPDDDSATAKAIEELDKSVGDRATTLRQEAIADPTKVVQNVDLSATQDTLAAAGKASAEAAAKGAVNALAIVTAACDLKNFMTYTKIAAQVLRARSLTRYAGIFMTGADQLKTGDKVSGDEVNALMTSIEGMEQSGGWQRASGANPKAALKTAPKYSLDLTKQGGGGAFFVDFSNKIDGLYGVGAVCAVATNIFFQIFATVGTVTLAIFTGGGSSLVSGAISGGIAGAILGTAEQIIQPMVIQMLAGMTVTGDEPGKDKGDAIFGGADIIYNSFNRQNGGRRLTDVEVTSLDRELDAQSDQDAANRTLIAKIFDLDNARSLASKALFETPTSPKAVMAKVDGLVASINPFMIGQTALSPNGALARFSGTANAADSADEDPLGVPQYGLTTAELEEFGDPIENENYILDDPVRAQQYKDFQQNCLNKAVGNVAAVDDTDNDCDLNDEITRRFRIYHLDKGIAGGIDYMSGSVDTLPNDDEDFAADAPVAGDTTGSNGGVVAGGAQGADTTAQVCPAGTTDAGTATVHDGAGQNAPTHNIRLCKSAGVLVNVSIAGNVLSMYNAARAAGVNLNPGSAFRTYQAQIDARRANGCADIYTTPSRSCTTPTAIPGTSNHEQGEAIDWQYNGATICFQAKTTAAKNTCKAGNAGFQWLAANASKYGFKNFPVEPWHWSVDGT